MSAVLGIGLVVAQGTPVEAAGISIPGCNAGAAVNIIPGQSGSGDVTFDLGTNVGPVTLNVTTTSEAAGTPIGTEALLDGNGAGSATNPGNGLRVTLTDSNNMASYGIGAVTCLPARRCMR